MPVNAPFAHVHKSNRVPERLPPLRFSNGRVRRAATSGRHDRTRRAASIRVNAARTAGRHLYWIRVLSFFLVKASL